MRSQFNNKCFWKSGGIGDIRYTIIKHEGFYALQGFRITYELEIPKLHRKIFGDDVRALEQQAAIYIYDYLAEQSDAVHAFEIQQRMRELELAKNGICLKELRQSTD